MLVGRKIYRNKTSFLSQTMNSNQWTRNYTSKPKGGKTWDEREKSFEDKDVRDHDTILALNLAKKLEEARLVCRIQAIMIFFEVFISLLILKERKEKKEENEAPNNNQDNPSNSNT